MNDALIPALVALGGGSALAGSIVVHEARRDQAMRSSRHALGITFPARLDPAAAEEVLSAVASLKEPSEIIFETLGTEKGITHAVHVPQTVESSVRAIMQTALPGLRFTKPEERKGRSVVAVRLYLPPRIILRSEDPAAASRSILSVLGRLQPDEIVAIRWAARPTAAPRYERPEDPVAREHWRAWERKAAVPGFQVAGMVVVRAERSRARELAEHVVATVRARRGQSGDVRPTWDRSARLLSALPRVSRTSGWLTPAELAGVISWPLGPIVVPGVTVGAAREILAPRGELQGERVLFLGRDTGGERVVGISARAATHHMAVIGPSGVGKSTLLTNTIISDLVRGHGGILLDPKADLVDEVANRVPAEHADRVVILDPAAGGAVPGVDVFKGGDPDLTSDVILGALASIYQGNWGIRSDHYGRLALRTLATMPGATLANLGRLFADPAYRRQAMTHLDDPLMRAAWQQFEELSTGEMATHIQPFLTKAMTLLSRPAVRAVLASPEPKLDISQLLAERRWLLISLSPGRLGEPASKLLGAVLLYSAWSAIEGRASLPPAHRHEVFLYIDELATIASLPFGFELLAERARGLGAGMVVALQTIGRLPTSVASSLLGNTATLITWRAGAEEAGRLARELPGITPDDLMALGPFEVAARVSGGAGSGTTVVTGRSQPPLPTTNMARTIRERSAELYGSRPMRVDAPIVEAQDAPVGRKRRAS